MPSGVTVREALRLSALADTPPQPPLPVFPSWQSSGQHQVSSHVTLDKLIAWKVFKKTHILVSSEQDRCPLTLSVLAVGIMHSTQYRQPSAQTRKHFLVMAQD